MDAAKFGSIATKNPIDVCLHFLFNFIFTYSVGFDPRGGTSYERHRLPPDVIADSQRHYSPPEREAFPYYFNRREQRKKELLVSLGWVYLDLG
jgi:hypothetical protein